MATVVTFTLTTKQSHLKHFIVAIVRGFEIPCSVEEKSTTLVCTFDDTHENFEALLKALEEKLPASLFLKGIEVEKSTTNPLKIPEFTPEYPLGLGICPSCQKEMFDVSSRRYYYPFTSCSCCGGKAGFLQAYPYSRLNSSLKYLVACDECTKESLKKGLKEDHHFISCCECAIPVRLSDGKSERFANDKGSFRTLFEVAAKALRSGKKLLVKTTFGYRVFYKTDAYYNHSTKLMMINAQKITDYLSLIPEEFNALLSIERPILHVTLKDETLKELITFNTAFVKYADEGFSILLGAELQKLGIDYIGYEEADEDTQADLVMDFDVELQSQSDMHYFLNKDSGFIASGERVSFPFMMRGVGSVLSVTNELAGVTQDNGEILFDRLDRFGSVDAKRVCVSEDFPKQIAPKEFRYSVEEGSFMSAIAERELFGQKTIGIYFEKEASFLYYNGKNIVRAVPPHPFRSDDLLERIANLREGSSRLVENLQKQLPRIYDVLKELEGTQVDLFDVISTILELKEGGFRGVSKEAMQFLGKGGIQIDMHMRESRFDYEALLASIISYRLAGVKSVIMSYSLFESFGDFFYDIYSQIASKTKTKRVVLCGSYFANQSLFSRMQRNFGVNGYITAKSFPIGSQSEVIGGAYL